MKYKSLRISEHAVHRYAERVIGITSVTFIADNISTIRNQLTDSLPKYLICSLGDGKYPINKNRLAVVRNGVVTTIL